ncbi:MAG: hypothetical protein SFV81_21120 [Pirellulaceae bacterium]|nr:hypothetical protein [Pirellulaceae bacterium]
MNNASFVGSFAGEGAAGVASLDPPLIQQTKSEIRALAGEIAKLAHSAVEPAAFYRGFLPRLVTAMGAEGAAVWQTYESLTKHGELDARTIDDRVEGHPDSNGKLRLLAHQCLADELMTTESITNSQQDRREAQPNVKHVVPTESHQRILECVIAEGAPILVPPQTVNIDADRPTNPLEHSLIVIPVRIEDEVEYVLEVVQSSSGGPAAQRGYLRFVAQMADLMADFLRRQSLREHAARTLRLQQFEYWLTSIAQAGNPARQLRLAADGSAELLNSSQVIILRSGRRPKVLVASGLDSFDPRSETIMAAQSAERFLREQPESSERCLDLCKWKSGTERLTSVSNLYELLVSERLVRVRLAEQSDLVAILALNEDAAPSPSEMERVASALFGLVDQHPAQANWILKWWPFRTASRSTVQPKRVAWQRWAIRVACVGIAVAIAFLPVPQRITTTAVLSPKSKNCYYAPIDATVTEISIGENEPVLKGRTLLQLESVALNQSLNRLTDEQTSNQVRQEYLEFAMSAANASVKADRDLEVRRIGAELEQVKGKVAANEREQAFIRAEIAKLKIVALEDGELTSWDISNRLLGRPVARGELLLSTCEPTTDWELQVSIPEHRVGLVGDAFQQYAGQTVPMRFSLTSHPNLLIDGQLTWMADQATRNAGGANVVLSKAAIVGKLPLKKEGAIAHVTIDCGRVPAIWLVIRDAYWACISRLKMMW